MNEEIIQLKKEIEELRKRLHMLAIVKQEKNTYPFWNYCLETNYSEEQRYAIMYIIHDYQEIWEQGVAKKSIPPLVKKAIIEVAKKEDITFEIIQKSLMAYLQCNDKVAKDIIGFYYQQGHPDNFLFNLIPTKEK